MELHMSKKEIEKTETLLLIIGFLRYAFQLLQHRNIDKYKERFILLVWISVLI